MSWGTSVQWLDYGVGQPGFTSGRGKNFSLRNRVQNGSGAHPVWYPMGVLSPGGEDDYLPPSTAEVKNEWSYTSTPHTSSKRGA
jgi:hypothetical protein